MKQFLRLRTLASGLSLGAVLLFGAGGSVSAAASQSKPLAPPLSSASGQQSKPAVAPGSKDAQAMAPLGPTDTRPSNAAASPRTGTVSGVDFAAPYNYCWKNLTYTTVTNTTSSPRSIEVRLYNQAGFRTLYTTVGANSTTYPAFYGVDGSYTAQLYVLVGSSYQYDEYITSNNTCNVSVTRTYNAGGWVQLKIQNLGTDYATQISSELAPYPAYGTYTGTQYDYPAAGGAAIYRWFWVSTSPYGIASSTYGSFNMPAYFTGDL